MKAITVPIPRIIPAEGVISPFKYAWVSHKPEESLFNLDKISNPTITIPKQSNKKPLMLYSAFLFISNQYEKGRAWIKSFPSFDLFKKKVIYGFCQIFGI